MNNPRDDCGLPAQCRTTVQYAIHPVSVKAIHLARFIAGCISRIREMARPFFVALMIHIIEIIDLNCLNEL